MPIFMVLEDQVRVLVSTMSHSIIPSDINSLSFDSFARDPNRDIACLTPIRTIIRREEEIVLDSLIIETLFENRLQQAAELNRMDATIRVQGNCALIQGVPNSQEPQ